LLHTKDSRTPHYMQIKHQNTSYVSTDAIIHNITKSKTTLPTGGGSR
jgi:hypothetical protein